MAFYVLEFHAAWDLLELVCYFLLLSAFLTPRGTIFRAVIAVLAVWAILLLNRNIDGVIGIYSWILPLCLVFAASWPVYGGRWDFRILSVLICYLLIGVVDNMAVYGISAVLGVAFGELTWKTNTYLLAMSAAKLLEVVLAWLSCRIIRRRDLNAVKSKWVLLSLLFPATSAGMIRVIYYYSINTSSLSLPTVVFSAALGAANAAILYIIHVIEKSTQQEQEMELLRQQITYQRNNFESLENSYRTQRKSVHEFERHLRVLTDLLEADELQAAEKYLRKLNTNRSLHVFSVNSRHPVIDVILNQKYQLAQEQNIRMHVEVNDLSGVEVQTDYLVVLLSNLLDNALEACMRLPENRQILCRIVADENLYVSVRNTSQPVALENGRIVTKKDDCREHGYGMPAIRYVLDSLQAEYAFDYHNGWFRFVAEIPM
jgi:signal transduction histidine kinase